MLGHGTEVHGGNTEAKSELSSFLGDAVNCHEFIKSQIMELGYYYDSQQGPSVGTG